MSDEELERIKKLLQNHEDRLKKLEGAFVSTPKPITKNISLREFLISKNPVNDLQRTLAIGYFLENNEAMDSFNTKDLDEGFRNAKEKVPKNINDKAYQCIKKGFLQESKEKKDNLKTWTLTRTGEDYVRRNFREE